MEYKEALDYIHGVEKFGSVLGIQNISRLLNHLGNPEENLKIVHVAGTNGKGSVSTMIASVLTKMGYKTGLYTSPYLEKFNERIKTNGEEIPDKDLADAITVVKKAIDHLVEKGYPHNTEFEIITAVALYYYNKIDADFVVLEVGLGGDLDATNAVKHPVLEVITSIGFDHTEYLGNSLSLIAEKKGGIIKENSEVVIYPSPKEAVDTLVSIAKNKNTQYRLCKKEEVEIIKNDITGIKLEINYDNIFGIKELEVSLSGTHQAYNTLTALKALEALREQGYSITKENIMESFNKISFNGRFEVLNKDPLVIIDGCHNKDGVTSFCNNLSKYFDEKIVLFYGMLKDKDITSSIPEFCKIADIIYTLTPNNPRAISSQELAKRIKDYDNGIKVVALERNQDIVNVIKNYKDRPVAIAGSLYLIGEIRILLNKEYL